MAQASRTTRSNHLLNLKIHICVLLSFLLIQMTCPIQELSQASSAKGFQTWKRLASSPNVMIMSKKSYAKQTIRIAKLYPSQSDCRLPKIGGTAKYK